MKEQPPSKDHADLDQIALLLDEGLARALQATPDVKTQAKVARRRWFGVGMLVLAVFCMAVAAVPWPAKQPIDLGMWICFAVVLLAIGGWQIDKAGKEALQASQLGETLFPRPPSNSPSEGIRRVK